MAEVQWARAILAYWNARFGSGKDERGAIENVVWAAGICAIAAIALAIILVKVRNGANDIDTSNPVPDSP